MANRSAQRFLFLAAILLMLSSIFISGFTLWYLTKNKDSLNVQLQNSLKDELAKYKFPVQEPITIDDAKLYISVAKYCEAHNDCIGPKGADSFIAGPQGVMGLQGLLGIQGVQGLQGLQGLKGDTGIDGPTGLQGETGPPGRTLEERCYIVNPTRRRIEQKYTDSETWEIKYYLAPGQLCPEEVQE